MSWNCNNTCHVITTNHARRIIAANSPLTLPLVEFIDLDGSRFRVNVSDAPCLKIVIDLKDGGGNVLQDIGILIDNLATVRNTTYSSDALQQVRCNALCPVPFSVQLSSDVELIVCEAYNPCCCPESEQQKEDARYLMLIAFFLGLLLLLFFLSLVCYFWRQWYPNPCGLCCPQSKNTMKAVTSVACPIITNSPATTIPEPQIPPVITMLEPQIPPVITMLEPQIPNLQLAEQFSVISSNLAEIKVDIRSIAVSLSKSQNVQQSSAVLESDVKMLSTVMLPSDLKPEEQRLILSDLSISTVEVSPVVPQPSDLKAVEQMR